MATIGLSIPARRAGTVAATATTRIPPAKRRRSSPIENVGL